MFQFLTYPLRAWHRRGFDIQSPWAYELVNDVFFERHAYYAYDKLNMLRQAVAPQSHDNRREDDELLFRIANRFAPKSVVEIGSPLSASYLACPHSATSCRVFTTETDGQSLQTFRRLGLDITDSCEAKLIADHLRQDTPDILHIAKGQLEHSVYDTMAQLASGNTVVIINGIHSKNKSLWKKIVDFDERATVTFDLLRCGVVTFDPKRVKQNYLL